MSCNCGGNDYNISIGNNGNCEPSTPEYHISLGGVGVNGYSPVVNFVNRTEQSFSIEVSDIDGIRVSEPVPLLSYVSDQIDNVNTTIANLGDTYLTKNGSNATLPFTISKFKILSDGSVRVTNEDITGYLYVKEIRPRNASGITIGYNNYNAPINIVTSDKAYYNGSEILTVNNLPDINTKLNTDGSNANNNFIINSDYISLGNRDNASVGIFTADVESFTVYNGYSTALRAYNNIVSVHSPLDDSLQRIATVDQIPTVGNGTITLTQGGVTKGTFTTNQSGNTTIELDAGGNITNKLDKDGSNADANISINGNTLASNGIYRGIGNINIGNKTTLGANSTSGYLSLPSFTITAYDSGSTLNTSEPFYINRSNDAKVYYHGTLADNEIATIGQLPSVYNPTITFTQGGVTKGTITLNQSTNQTIALDAGGSGGGAVDSVNGQTGDVVLDASDVGALPDTTVIPTKTSDLTNDSNFATVSQIPTNNNQLTNGAGYITNSALNGYAKTADLAAVATSGSYNDLTDKPTIPSAVTESTVSGWGFTKNTGTVTSVNNVSPVNGNVTLSIPSTNNLANKDLSNLSSTGNSKFQTPLVSGTNIKTINSTSLLGSGNIDTLTNTASKATSITIGGTASTSSYTTNVGIESKASASAAQAFGHYAIASGQYSLALGQGAEASNSYSIQIGKGTNSTAKSLSVGFGSTGNYQLLDGTTGLIPDARLSSNIARTNDIPNISNLANTDLSNLSTTGQAVIDGKVSKSGDTMTGALKLDMTTVGSTNENFQDIQFVLDDINRAGLRCSHLTDGTNRVEIIVRNNSGTLASGYEASNNNGTLSCRFPNTTCVDGQWQYINTVIMDNVSVKGSSNLTYTLSDIPNDGNMYEVMLTGSVQTGTTNGHFCALQLKSDFNTGAVARVCSARTRSSSFVQAQGTVIIPLTTSHNIYVTRNSGWTGTAILTLIGYRRIGTNN